MTSELACLIAMSTCPRCNGEGVLHSSTVKYEGNAAWHTHLVCDLCRGSGINPAVNAKEKTDGAVHS